jgi:hypothetical protein
VLVKAYQATERLLKHEKDERVLQYAAAAYAQMLTVNGLFEPDQGRILISNIQSVLHSGALRAVLHRFNCDLMRCLSGNIPCPHRCCCRCEAGYRNIACNAWLTEDQQPHAHGPAN